MFLTVAVVYDTVDYMQPLPASVLTHSDANCPYVVAAGAVDDDDEDAIVVFAGVDAAFAAAAFAVDGDIAAVAVNAAVGDASRLLHHLP